MSETPETPVSQPPVERVFPPWPAGRIVFWIAVGFILSIIMGILIGLTVTTLSIYLVGGIDEGMAQIAGHLALFLQGPIVFSLILLLLRRKGFTLGDAWGAYSLEVRQLWTALLAGVAFMSATDLSVRVFHIEAPPLPALAWDWRLLLASDVLTTALIAAFMEELLFRGLLYRAFRLRFSVLNALLFSSLIFALIHTQYIQYPFYMAVVFLMGVVCAFLLERTRSLNSSIAFHFAANTTAITTSYFNHPTV